MERTINRNLLKYSAGTAIFCPRCDTVADCRRWVIVGDCGAMCAPCWDKALGNRPIPENLEVLDGREVFSTKRVKA